MTEMSAAEAAVVARFDAAEPAPESWRGGDGLRDLHDPEVLRRWLLIAMPRTRGADALSARSLVPTVQRLMRQYAAEELRAAARDLDLHGCLDAPVPVLLQLRADTLDGPPC